jgi:hypothetical protein
VKTENDPVFTISAYEVFFLIEEKFSVEEEGIMTRSMDRSGDILIN